MDSDSQEFTEFVTELRHASGLLISGGIANERMALAIIDSLAERLLYHHAQRCFSAADARIGILVDPFPASRRRQILGDFRKRVQLALVDEEFFVFIDPSLDQGKSFMRVAADSVTGRGESGSDRPPELSPRDASRPIIDEITDPLRVDEAELAKKLHADGDRRLDEVDRLIGGPRRDLDDDRVAELIEGAQHWAQHRGDEELHRLAREEQIIENEDDALEEHEHDDELMRRKAENLLAKFARMKELRRETEVRVDLATVGSLRDRFGRLTEKSGIGTLLDSYRQLDELLEVLETTVEWASDSWERSVQQAIDEALGK